MANVCLPCCKLRLTVSDDAPVALSVKDGESVSLVMKETVTVIHDRLPDWDGPYEVTPTASEQVLATAQRTMREDVTIHEIPYHQTSNDSGGYTVSIAS